ncbi:hypothetical protein ABIB87_008626, partial [Bradyrhizobium sp. JR18.2]
MTKVHESVRSVESGEYLLLVDEWKTHRAKPRLLLAPRDLHVPSQARRRIISASTCSGSRDEARRHCCRRRPHKQKRRLPKEAAFFIRTSKEEDFLSLAG